MSSFEVISENGLYRCLKSKNGMQTPMLVNTLEQPLFQQIVLSDRGAINLTALDFNGKLDIRYMDEPIPEWSIISPRLTINFENLRSTQVEEEELFLERLGNTPLPNTFGLIFDPENSKINYLEELLRFKPSIIVIKIASIEKQPSVKTLEIINITRSNVPSNVALYLAGGVPIGFFGLFVMLGIDIFDDNSIYRLASGNKSFEDGFVEHSQDSLEAIIEINQKELYRDFNSTIKHIKKNTIWTRIARDMHSHPKIASMMTIIGNKMDDPLFLRGYSSNQTNPISFTGEEAFYHPDVKNYHHQLMKNYEIPKSKSLLILLPCSAKKPYQESKSHREFVKAIKQVTRKYFNQVEIWSLTSPIGVVPRELERIYPAMYYDLPVTGNWSVEESQRCGIILQKMLQNVSIPIVAHVSQGYKQMVEIGLKKHPEAFVWIGDKPSKWEELEYLRKNVELATNNAIFQEIQNIKNSMYHSLIEINALVRYNHGIKSGLKFENIELQGRPPRPVQVQKNKKHYLSWDVLKGRVNLSVDAASDIALSSEKWVLTDTDKLQGSSLFAVGVFNASREIAPHDEILIFNKDKTKLLGTGIALVSGKTMVQLEYGRVADLRKKGVVEIA